MEKRGPYLTDIQDIPKESLILLAGPPGAGKSTFCHQTVLNAIVAERPTIFVTTEQSPSNILGRLKEKGMGEPAPGVLNFVDAFTETVGLACTQRPDTVCANCTDLNSLSMATTKIRERIGGKSILLAFDSLTSPYLFCGMEITKFMRLFLSRFAAEGNSVVALVDDGCGKKEDLGAMMSVADGIIKIEIKENSRTINVIKHPKVSPRRIEAPLGRTGSERIGVKYLFDNNLWDESAIRQFIKAWMHGDEATLRKEPGDYVNLFWPNLAQWSGMLWDPNRFPKLKYDLNKEDASALKKMLQFFPWHWRLLFKLMPQNLNNVKDMKKMMNSFIPYCKQERSGIVEYLEDISKTDEHYFRIYENFDCSAFENVGFAMAAYMPSNTAGMCEGTAKDGGEWNAIETKCIGLGDPYCEFKVVPGTIDELKDSLEAADSTVIERIHDRLMDRLMKFMLEGTPLVDRPRLGSDIHLHAVGHAFSFPYVAGERYQMALRMGGTKVGKEVGEHLIDAGLSEDEAVQRVIQFLKHCKVGKVTVGETVKIEDNCESFYMKLAKMKSQEPSCYFTSGFLNGLFSTVKNRHVREIKCIAAGDPYCQWEIV
jgi:predicted hydrocarbon binding protein/KaiC/GvpD/RAD55 family RecA-like ATPase